MQVPRLRAAACPLDLPILPIAICDTLQILPPDTLDLFQGRAIMKIHEPIDVGGYDEGSIERLISDVRSFIRTGMDEYQVGCQTGGKRREHP